MDAALKSLSGVDGKVGYLDPLKYPDGTSIAYIAAIQELGYAPRSLPPRPTIGPAMEANADKYREQFKKGAAAILRGEQTAESVMEIVMLGAAGDVQEKIRELVAPPLSPVTLLARASRSRGDGVTGKSIGGFHKELRKGPANLSGVSTKPLVDSGQMIQAVSGVAERSK